MNDHIVKEIAANLSIQEKQVRTVLQLLEEGNTIPFIARYRKEATGAINEEQIRVINEAYEYQVNLLKRKEDVIRLIDEKGMMTEELKGEILACQKLVEVEDLYRPYKEKKKTKATEAIALGLEPFAKELLSFPTTGSIDSLAKPYLTEKVPTVEKAVEGAKYIIAEMVSDQADYRKWIRNYVCQNGVMISKKKRHAEDEERIYEMYYEHAEAVNFIKPHRILAINRGEKEGVLSVSITVDQNAILSYLYRKMISSEHSFVVPIVKEAIDDSLSRLIYPSVEREVRASLKEIAEDRAIDNFSHNLENLLLTPPIKDKVVLGYDPAFRTGCKLAVLDKTGKPEEIAVIYPTEPHLKIVESKKTVLDLIDRYQIDLIAIGNGTASRESEAFIADTIKEARRPVEYVIVSEAGASVYSASPLAISEFPDLTVEKRSAISIGRRLQDALSELVKIDPKSIGVGLYQHDVPAKKLDESLNFIVTKTVNQVGVNINTASASLLQYVSGLGKKVIDKLLKVRDEKGKFEDREQLKKLMSEKTYEQSIGFLRILDGVNPLDKTSIHPESYQKAEELLNVLGFDLSSIGTEALVEELKHISIADYSKKLAIDHYTLEDIISSLENPGRDPRDELPKPLLRTDVLKLEDLHVGDQLQGTVRNVVDFGAFIDVGLHDDGLAHISRMSERFIKDPREVVAVGDIVDCYVEGIDLTKKRLSLSLIPLEKLKK